MHQLRLYKRIFFAQMHSSLNRSSVENTLHGVHSKAANGEWKKEVIYCIKNECLPIK